MQELFSDMAAIEKIRSRILQEARAEADEYVKKAGEQAEEILKKAQLESARKRTEILEKAGRDAEAAANKRLALHETEVRKETLRTKRQLIDETFAKVMERLKNMPEDQYFRFLSDMLSGVITDGKFRVVLSERDKNRLGEEIIQRAAAVAAGKGLKAELSLCTETADIAGGFILQEGDVEINYSLEALLRSHREELEELICAQLELGGEDHAAG